MEANYFTILWWFLPDTDMNQPWVYMCSPSQTSFLPPSPSHPSGSSQCTSPEHPVSCIEPGLAICFTYDNIHVSMLFSQIIPPLPSPTESKSLGNHFLEANSDLDFPGSPMVKTLCFQCKECRFNPWFGELRSYMPHGTTKKKKKKKSKARGFPGGFVVKNPPVNAGDVGSIPGLRRSPGGDMATRSSVLAWEIPWTEEPGGLRSMGLQRVGHDWSGWA